MPEDPQFLSAQQPNIEPAGTYAPGSSPSTAIGPAPQQPQQQQKGSPLKATLSRFFYGFGQGALHAAGLPTDVDLQNHQMQMANTASQIQERQQQTQLLAEQVQYGPAEHQAKINALTAQPRFDPQRGFLGVMNDAQYQQYLRGQGAAQINAGKKTPQQQLGESYLEKLNSGDSQGAQQVLQQLHDLSGATAKPTSPMGKIDPIVYQSLGPPPDPTSNPAGAKQWAVEAEKIKTRMAVAPRVAGYNALNMGRPVQAYDPATDQYTFNTVGGAMHDGLMPAGLAFKNMPKIAQFGEMQTASKSLRSAIQNLDVDFTPSQRAKLQMAMSAPSESVLANQVSSFLGSEQLTPAQQDFVIWSKQMNERLLSLRNVAGMGQGSEDMRRAIQGTLPNVKSADKGYALKQMDAVDQQIGSLYGGIGGKNQIPATVRDKMAGGTDMGAAPAGKAEGSTGTLPDGTKIVIKGGRIIKK